MLQSFWYPKQALAYAGPRPSLPVRAANHVQFRTTAYGRFGEERHLLCRAPAMILRGWHPYERPEQTSLSREIWRRLGAALIAFDEWRERARERYLLLSLDEHTLKDLGLDRSRVYQETVRRFWQN